MGSKIKKCWELLKFIYFYYRYHFRDYQSKTGERFVAHTNYGPVCGQKRVSFLNAPFYSFEKVPFARPPIGQLRFKAPEPPEPWTNVLDCTKEGIAPLQFNFIRKIVEGCEDCLYLNIYSKNINPKKPLPVIVWIYGGGFISGAASKLFYGPDYFMQKDVILVAITYRVGIFGFLTLKDPNVGVPGNAGLKDQIAALRWIKSNISNFGGDFNNITILGESAGSASLHYLTIINEAKNLFNKAILMSGTVLNPWAVVPHYEMGYRIAKLAGYSGDNNDADIYEFLMKTKGTKLVAPEPKLLNLDEKKRGILVPYGPVIEPYITENTIVPKSPRLMLREAWGNNIPIIIGGTSFEGLLIYPDVKKNPQQLEELGDFEYFVPLELGLEPESQTCKDLGIRLKKEYFKDETINKTSILKYCDILSYKHFWHGIYRTIQSRFKYSKLPTYLYRFDFDSEFFNHLRMLFCGKKMRGTCHGDDLSYLFLNALSCKLSPESKEYKTIDRMIGIVTAFAESGDPNCDSIQPCQWTPLDPTRSDAIECINISDECKMLILPEMEKIKVWNSLYPKDTLI